jgi:hypothetical protein
MFPTDPTDLKLYIKIDLVTLCRSSFILEHNQHPFFLQTSSGWLLSISALQVELFEASKQ